MQDTTVSTLLRASDSGAIPRRNISRRWADRGDEDELLARVLITSWTLATGRTLRAGVPAQSHSEDELITFWADDQMTTMPATIYRIGPEIGPEIGTVQAW
jgi:hypothetical protein